MERIKEILNHPESIKHTDIHIIQSELEKYPYYQPIRMLYLQAIKKFKASDFDIELEKNSIYFPYKTALFEVFNENKYYPSQNNIIENQNVFDTKIKTNENEIVTSEITNNNDTIASEIIERIEETKEDESIKNKTIEENSTYLNDPYYESLKKLGLEHLYKVEERESTSQSPTIQTQNSTEIVENKIEKSTFFEEKESEKEVILNEKFSNENTKIEVESSTVNDENNVDPLITEKTKDEKVLLKTIPPDTKLTFSQWLNLNRIQPYISDEKRPVKLDKKLDVIDNFIENNPKISPLKDKDTPNIESKLVINKDEISHLMTETFANLYIEQNKFSLAIKAFKILSLKYPEKSVYFANRIEEVKRIKI